MKALTAGNVHHCKLTVAQALHLLATSLPDCSFATALAIAQNDVSTGQADWAYVMIKVHHGPKPKTSPNLVVVS